jgi:hypothetical protein
MRQDRSLRAVAVVASIEAEDLLDGSKVHSPGGACQRQTRFIDAAKLILEYRNWSVAALGDDPAGTAAQYSVDFSYNRLPLCALCR